jgi:hypothetical protein
MIQEEKLLRALMLIRDEHTFICKSMQEKQIKQAQKIVICLNCRLMLNGTTMSR